MGYHAEFIGRDAFKLEHEVFTHIPLIPAPNTGLPVFGFNSGEIGNSRLRWRGPRGGN
jgi:hypothetical protein